MTPFIKGGVDDERKGDVETINPPIGVSVESTTPTSIFSSPQVIYMDSHLSMANGSYLQYNIRLSMGCFLA